MTDAKTRDLELYSGQEGVYGPQDAEAQGRVGVRTFEFTVPGQPKSERKQQVRMGQHAKRVDTADRKDWKVHIRACIAEAIAADPKWIRLPLKGPLTLHICYYRRRPDSYPKRPTKTHPWPFAWLTKPDLTNLDKIIEDCITDMGIWIDDAQVVAKQSYKLFGDTPRTEVRIEWDEQSRAQDTSDAGERRGPLSIGCGSS